MRAEVYSKKEGPLVGGHCGPSKHLTRQGMRVLGGTPSIYRGSERRATLLIEDCTMSIKIAPKNWKKFQHYTGRTPPWIKLHRSLLDDYKFHCLPIASKALAPGLWLLASEYENGLIDASEQEVAFRLRVSVPELRSAIKSLLDNGFFVDASGVLSGSYQDATLEIEVETEKEKEKKETRAGRATRLSSDWVPKEFREEAAELEKFKDWARSAPGQKGVKADWDAAWRNWVRRVREQASVTPFRPNGYQQQQSGYQGNQPVISRAENLARMKRGLGIE